PGELLEPALALEPRDRRVRRRGRREHEEPGVTEPPRLNAKLGPLVERPAVSLLADESDPFRPQLVRDLPQTLRRTGEVGATEVARSRRRPSRRVRHADAVRP